MIRRLFKWTALSGVVGVLAGSASAAFLYSLDWATRLRDQQPWLIWLLPIGGLAVGCLYHFWGRSIEGGNNLLLDEIHRPKAIVPLRMAPLIFIGTVATHIFGGSAGREGTAVQMGGSIADQMTKFLRLEPSAKERRVLLMCGMSAGFGSVFGVPLAGTVFGMEVLSVGGVEIAALFECAMASFVAHWTCLAWGIHHSVYMPPELPPLTLTVAGSLIIAGIFFGRCAWFFSWLTHFIRDLCARGLSFPPLRPVLGGVAVSVGIWAMSGIRFEGLGVPEIQQAMIQMLAPVDFAWKLAFTAVTLGSGFKGGEVTPLLFIGSTLGNSLGALLPVPFSLLSAVGFVAVFAGAANTPWACALMAMEIFGPDIAVFAVIGCVVSYYCSGGAGIYRSQKR